MGHRPISEEVQVLVRKLAGCGVTYLYPSNVEPPLSAANRAV